MFLISTIESIFEVEFQSLIKLGELIFKGRNLINSQKRLILRCRKAQLAKQVSNIEYFPLSEELLNDIFSVKIIL